MKEQYSKSVLVFCSISWWPKKPIWNGFDYFVPFLYFQIEFSIGESSRNSQKRAVNVKVVLRNVAGKCQGFIATLKDNYGFIENADHEKEVFFHFRWVIDCYFQLVSRRVMSFI